MNRNILAELQRRNVLRVGAAYIFAAWLLIQVAETIFPLFGFGYAPARIVVVVLAIGFLPSMIFAWAFELTPQGLKKESQVDRTRSIAPDTGKKLDRMALVILALALACFAFDKFVLDPQRELALELRKAEEVEQARQAGRTEALVESYGDKSIAVLAFQDMSPDNDQEYLSDGIAEELLNLLAKIPELRVISRSSAFSYKGKDIKLAQMAEELNVANILEGSVRKAGDRVRITAQLIEARSDTHLWSDTYDRTLDDIFAIQDDIAAKVVEQLKLTLLGEVPHADEVDLEAYSLFLQARHVGRLNNAESYDESIALYRRALEVEPEYAAAWFGLAVIYINQANKDLRPVKDGFSLAREAAEKALEIDPEYALAHSGLGWIAMSHDRNLAAAARHFERALALEPDNLSMIGNAAVLLQSLARQEQAIALMEYVAARDPLNPTSHYNLAINYGYVGRQDEAIAAYRTALRLSPEMVGAHHFVGMALLLHGQAGAALEAMQQEPFEAYRLIGLALAHHALAQHEASDRVLAELIEKHETGWAYNIAYVFAYRNETDQAFEWLNKAVEYADPGLTDISVEPLFASLHNDPRWLPLLQSMGKAPEQLAAIEFSANVPGLAERTESGE
ncbi:MAG: tetratricopeptide repeat protein [Wenzhouxiangellaceae bacterium]|nr:tetratricopeptide repeat protein [Wenzhouxiangellaceae bacterium]